VYKSILLPALIFILHVWCVQWIYVAPNRIHKPVLVCTVMNFCVPQKNGESAQRLSDFEERLNAFMIAVANPKFLLMCTLNCKGTLYVLRFLGLLFTFCSLSPLSNLRICFLLTFALNSCPLVKQCSFSHTLEEAQ